MYRKCGKVEVGNHTCCWKIHSRERRNFQQSCFKPSIQCLYPLFWLILSEYSFFQIYLYEKYGKNQLKKYQISPDAVAQLGDFLFPLSPLLFSLWKKESKVYQQISHISSAFQLGHFRLHNKIVATYESASTAGFKVRRKQKSHSLLLRKRRKEREISNEIFGIFLRTFSIG